MITTLGSYVMGWLRDRTLAHTFGASTSLDSYNAAFLIPDFIFNVLVASGIAAAAVPLFTEIYRRNKVQAYEYLNALTVIAVISMSISGVLLFVFAAPLSYLVAPGLTDESRLLVVQLMRIVAFSPILFAASNALGAMLIAQKRFLLYGVSPLLYNLGIICGAVFLTPTFGIMGVAYGTLFGGFLHLFVRVIDAVFSGWRLNFSWQWQTPEMKRTVYLMAPKMIGHPVELGTFWVFTSFASFLAPGSITVLNYARNFQSVPVSVLGIAMATAVFPSLAQAALQPGPQLKELFRRTTAIILFTSIVAALIVYIIRHPLIDILLGGGEFNAEDVTRTALVLGVFCLSIPTEALNHLFARAFYATQNTIIPVIWSVISFIIAGGSAYLLMGSLDVVAFPLAFFFGSIVKTIGLYILFWRKTEQKA